MEFRGKGVFDAIAIGRISFVKEENETVPIRISEDWQAEIRRLVLARKRAKEELGELFARAKKELGEADAMIFQVHQMVLEDVEFNKSVEILIHSQHVNAEYAVSSTAEFYAKRYEAMDDSYMRERAADVRDVAKRWIACLETSGEGHGQVNKKETKADSISPENKLHESKQTNPESETAAESVILCARDLTPSDTMTLSKDKVLAFVTAYGTSNSHTAILARSRNIAAVVGVGDAFLQNAKEGDLAIVDGSTGIIYLNPEEELLLQMKKKQKEKEACRTAFQNLKGKESITKSGVRVKICANIGSVDAVEAVLENDAEGVGLFRSEFLYLEQSDYPTEEQQFQAYKRVLKSMPDKRVIIRTLDIGADKQIAYFGLEKEDNPAMGLRAIRLCLKRPEIFKQQLRALYRASVYGKLGIMYPMITDAAEVEQIAKLTEEVKQELRRKEIPFCEQVETGIMLETPAAVIMSDRLAKMVDFFSVGTNDLTQYTLACDRQNPHMEEYCDNYCESVMRLISHAANTAHKYGKWIGICGEMAADTSLTKQFLEMGIDELSVEPSVVLKLRSVVREIE